MIKLAAVLSIAVAFVIVGCKGPEGPTGPGGTSGKDGKDGKDAGFVYFEGFKDSLVCSKCHVPDGDTTYFVEARVRQYEASIHSTRGNYDRNSTSCAGCHTTEGFMERASKGLPGGFTGQVVTGLYSNASPPGCFACHSPHKSGDFSFRGNAVPVVLGSNVVGVTGPTFDYGKGNLCAQCHQPRSFTPNPDPTKTGATDTLTISNARWYSHYGVQSQMLMGTGGFEFVGGSFGVSTHTNAVGIKKEGCVACHMADPALGGGSGKVGGHTMNMVYTGESGSESQNLTGCNATGCHTGLTSFDYVGASTGGVGTQTLVQKRLDSLALCLMDTSIVNKWNKGKKVAWITKTSSIDADDTTWTFGINAGSGSAALKIVPAAKSGALYNFMFVEHDMSLGVHNTKYALALLNASIIELKK